MSLPWQIQSRLTSEYNGIPSARFDNSLEAHNFQAQLKELGVSHQTKIRKHKRHGREFVVMVLDAQNAA